MLILKSISQATECATSVWDISNRFCVIDSSVLIGEHKKQISDMMIYLSFSDFVWG